MTNCDSGTPFSRLWPTCRGEAGLGRPRLSQHFLHNPRTARRIAAAVRAPPGADVLEIGAGGGALTEHLIARGWRVTAVELDPRLAAALEERWGDREEFRLVQGDILDFRLGSAGGEGKAWHVAGNLPYAITSPIVFHLLDQVNAGPIADMVLMVQREVAERLAAGPGSKAYGALTVGVRLQADVEKLFEVGPGEFRPAPRIRSSVVRLTPHDRWELDGSRLERVRRLVRRAFGQRRKQLQKILRTSRPWMLDRLAAARIGEAAGIDLSRRPETLGVEEWLRLEAVLAAGPAER
ncbi:MAG TPA: 16S rRNA (adenine(1518)-N(6)/adenine(1519)-N(6))-dimethyltransferase RsmA [Gemmatimonadota bacterium]|nr:16S rRNA (adenine(1518)-N(6)/adenine(1519)-N(6))-dimethyltransferase RsmA [Gemmatimonadota bacterium]